MCFSEKGQLLKIYTQHNYHVCRKSESCIQVNITLPLHIALPLKSVSDLLWSFDRLIPLPASAALPLKLLGQAVFCKSFCYISHLCYVSQVQCYVGASFEI